MTDASSQPDLLTRLAEEFAERYRRGERPGPAEYAARYPELAADIRALFPALMALEEFGSVGRAAARLHHTNIVPVFGVGEHQGVPYYAMQFIQGRPLDAVARELQRLRERPSASAGTAPPETGPTAGAAPATVDGTSASRAGGD